MYRSATAYGGEGRGEQEHYFVPQEEEDCTSEDFDLDSESSEDAKGGRSVRRSLSLEIYGLQREPHVHFSNREYYRRLEALKSAHLRNMAELEDMYISQGRERRAEEDEGGRQSREDRLSVSSGGGPARKLQRINSQEELDFHDTSSGSDLMGELDLRRTPVEQDRAFGSSDGSPPSSPGDFMPRPEETLSREQFPFRPEAAGSKPRGSPSRPTGDRVRSSFKATVPKPFQMMLREEERKRRKVRTRSEMELENTLLRRELEELQECQKKFRASPAPAHIHLPLYEMISRRPDRSRGSGADTRSQQPPAAPPQPFHFLERERRKREAKILAELGRLQGPQEEEERRRAFRARPMPSSVYGAHAKKTTSRQFVTLCSPEREAAGGGGAPTPEPEPDAWPRARRPCRGPSSKTPKKQIEMSIEMVKERECPCTDL